MATLSDLEAAITAVGGTLTRLSTDVQAIVDKLKTSGGTIPDADVSALAAIATSLGAEADKIEAVINPPPPPAV